MASLDRVTRCYGERLLQAARRYCRNEEEARDAVQEATLAAWRHGEGFRGDGRVERWLVRLVATACSRMRRGLKNDRRLHVSFEDMVADEPSPEILSARSELAAVLGDALLDLPARDRAILLLSDGEGWKAPEIARALGTSSGAVRTRLSRAHRRLRERLTPELRVP